MKAHILGNHRFVLGLQVTWDSYEEIAVEFVRNEPRDDQLLYVFRAAPDGRTFVLTPRYLGDRIEGAAGGTEVVVNAEIQEAGEASELGGQLRSKGTGVLRIIPGSTLA